MPCHRWVGAPPGRQGVTLTWTGCPAGEATPALPPLPLPIYYHALCRLLLYPVCCQTLNPTPPSESEAGGLNVWSVNSSSGSVTHWGPCWPRGAGGAVVLSLAGNSGVQRRTYHSRGGTRCMGAAVLSSLGSCHPPRRYRLPLGRRQYKPRLGSQCQNRPSRGVLSPIKIASRVQKGDRGGFGSRGGELGWGGGGGAGGTP